MANDLTSADLPVHELLAMARDLERRAMTQTKKQWPTGSVVKHRHGDRIRVSEVVDHSRYNPRLRVRGVTGSLYWLDAGQILEETTP